MTLLYSKLLKWPYFLPKGLGWPYFGLNIPFYPLNNKIIMWILTIEIVLSLEPNIAKTHCKKAPQYLSESVLFFVRHGCEVEENWSSQIGWSEQHFARFSLVSVEKFYIFNGERIWSVETNGELLLHRLV